MSQKATENSIELSSCGDTCPNCNSEDTIRLPLPDGSVDGEMQFCFGCGVAW